jgi:uncharacterized membrane protein YkoI
MVFMLAATMIFAFAGCGSQQEEVPEETAASATEEAAEEQAEEAAETQTEAAAEDAAENTANDIGIDKATEIALADAGLTESDVKFTKQKSDIDDGVSIYEVEFTSGETKYEYDIDAASGKILDRDTDSIYDD